MLRRDNQGMYAVSGQAGYSVLYWLPYNPDSMIHIIRSAVSRYNVIVAYPADAAPVWTH